MTNDFMKDESLDIVALSDITGDQVHVTGLGVKHPLDIGSAIILKDKITEAWWQLVDELHCNGFFLPAFGYFICFFWDIGRGTCLMMDL